MPPFLIIQGTADLNIPMSIPRSFAQSYRIAGGDVELEEFPEMPHNFVTEASEATDRALELTKAFVARQLSAAPARV
jgi:acetyl esterase/lipase